VVAGEPGGDQVSGLGDEADDPVLSGV